jgi:hypothetical protein
MATMAYPRWRPWLVQDGDHGLSKMATMAYPRWRSWLIQDGDHGLSKMATMASPSHGALGALSTLSALGALGTLGAVGALSALRALGALLNFIKKTNSQNDGVLWYKVIRKRRLLTLPRGGYF